MIIDWVKTYDLKWKVMKQGKPKILWMEVQEKSAPTYRHSFHGLISRTTWVSWHQKG